MKRILLLTIPGIILASCGGGDKAEKNSENLDKLKKERAALDEKISKLEGKVVDTTRKPTAIAVQAVQPGNFISYIQVQSQITGDQNTTASPQMGGIIKSISVRAGQHVSKGQVLATLDASMVEQQIKAQDVQLNLTKTLYEKQQALWAQNIGTEVQLLQAKANYESALKQRDATIAQRNMYRITSPINGIVDQMDLKIGDAVQPGMSGIRVVSFDKLKAEANLGENYLGKVKEGNPVVLVFPDLNDSITTKLNYVAKAVDPLSRAFVVQVRLGNNKKLSPNMSCIMKIANYENKSALVVPVSVIQKTSKGDMLYIADGNKAKAVYVSVGRTSNGLAEILSGLKAGDKVITEGYEDLDNGELITTM